MLQLSGIPCRHAPRPRKAAKGGRFTFLSSQPFRSFRTPNTAAQLHCPSGARTHHCDAVHRARHTHQLQRYHGRPPSQSAVRKMKMLLLCCSLAVVLQPSRALFDLRGASVSLQLRAAAGGGGGYGEEKVPMTVVVPDYSPRPAPFGAPAPTPAPAPVPVPALAPLPGSDGGGDDMPTLPSERRSPGREPSGGNAGAPAPAAASGGTSTAFISSSPAVPLPAGVTDSATVLPMPTPGQEQQVVGMGTLLRARTVQQLALPLAMMLFFWALW